MSEGQSFHIPPPNDDLKNLSSFISDICIPDRSEKWIIWNISQLAVQELSKHITLINKVIQSKDPDTLIGAPLYLVIEDSTNGLHGTNDEAKAFLAFILEELQKRLQEAS